MFGVVSNQIRPAKLNVRQINLQRIKFVTEIFGKLSKILKSLRDFVMVLTK